MPDDQPITDEPPQGHRAGAWVVLVMGLIGLALGIYQWRGSFAAAFARTGPAFKTPDQVESDRIAALKTKDTDSDGLTDYDETYIYKTSPYLKDSDSDGIADKTEINKGTDPNCAGDQCAALSGTAIVSATTTDQATTDVAAQILNPTPAQIRALMLQSGLKQEDLDKIDDATLLDLYRQSLQEVQNASSTGATTP